MTRDGANPEPSEEMQRAACEPEPAPSKLTSRKTLGATGKARGASQSAAADASAKGSTSGEASSDAGASGNAVYDDPWRGKDGPTRRERIKDYALDKTPQKLRHPSALQVRFRTGFVYVTVSVLCLVISNWTTLALLVATAGVCAGEFYYMLRSDAKLPNEMLGIVGAMLYPICVFFFGTVGIVYACLATLLALLVWYVFWQRARVPDVGVSFFGAAYCGLLLCGVLVVRMALPQPWGGVLVLLLFTSVWANDSFAYLVGSKFGKHKLAPRTSPKKSWEGFFAGLVGSAIFWVLMTFVPGVTMPIPMAIVFGLISGLMGVLGDLAESRIKRNSGVKDSGTIMPGHGGLLDRCDSLFLVAATGAILLIGGGCIPFSV